MRRNAPHFLRRLPAPPATSPHSLLLLVVRRLAAQARERFADFYLETARRGPIVAAVGHFIREISLAFDEGAGLVVCVSIAVAVAELLHELGRCIAETQRHVER